MRKNPFLGWAWKEVKRRRWEKERLYVIFRWQKWNWRRKWR